MKKILFLLAFPCYLFAQLQPPANLNCEQVRVWIKQNYYDGKMRSLGYSTARKKMYAFIDNKSDSLECVYSGYKQRHVRGNETTGILPINCEHTVPQSLFNSADPMVSDIHHLFPTYDAWNSDRGNLPFSDIPDALTTKWVRGINAQSTIPTVVIDEWSELNVRSGLYEPREKQKGNTARAILYFYTVYPTQAGAITGVASLQTLRQWHEQDPPDAQEIQRNNAVETYQGNRNPYIDNPSLVVRAWFNCTATGLNTPPSVSVSEMRIAPNPVGELAVLSFTAEKNMQSNVLIINELGQVVRQETIEIATGNNHIPLETADLTSGLYIVQIQTENGQVACRFIKR